MGFGEEKLSPTPNPEILEVEQYRQPPPGRAMQKWHPRGEATFRAGWR